MDKITALLLALLIPTHAISKEAVIYDYEILRVIDGDTVSIQADFLPKPLKPELHLRVFGVDTPEKGARAKCEQEAIKAKAASEYVKNLVATSTKKQVSLLEWDKYGGRVLGDVFLDGKSLRALLISNNYAREYYGAAKQSWCQ